MRTLADLKRKLKIGQAIKMVSWHGHTEQNATTPSVKAKLGIIRYVVKVQTNGVYFSPDKNAKTGSWWDFPTSNQIEVTDKGFKVFSIGERPLNEIELKVIEGRPRDEQQEYIDAISDGSQMYWRNKSYFEKSGYNYLWSYKWEQGLYHDTNKNVIKDKSLKGELELEYEFVD